MAVGIDGQVDDVRRIGRENGVLVPCRRPLPDDLDVPPVDEGRVSVDLQAVIPAVAVSEELPLLRPCERGPRRLRHVHPPDTEAVEEGAPVRIVVSLPGRLGSPYGRAERLAHLLENVRISHRVLLDDAEVYSVGEGGVPVG